MYRLKSTNGRVNTLFRSGKDFVKTELPTSAVQHIIDVGTLVKSDKPEYPICVDEKWYFEGTKLAEATPKKAPRKGRKQA